ncbi:hypothetical protein L596_008915 [Steinernema carpocapsae]|uniref:Saposin B-type domain-containing protein n=1 Tax=Steinernema carpocapsae TaxID=34508 RepID=A0A4U5PF04_STECR|nr:hypothetical protein L596_008915 [Steinernema carpocapsae]
MQLKVFLCVLLVLPAAFATCQDDYDKAKLFVNLLKKYSDDNIAQACDKPLREAIILYMIDAFDILAIWLQDPCQFTFQPLNFNSNCYHLDNQNNNKMVALLKSITQHLDAMCNADVLCRLSKMSSP